MTQDTKQAVKILQGESAPAGWDDYVNRRSQASACHMAAAVAIGERAFGLRTNYLAARSSDGQLHGLLPLIEQSSMVFGRFLVSVPFFTYGGVLAESDSVASALVQRAVELARERGAEHLELRHDAPMPNLELAERLDKVSMILQLPSNEEALAKQLGSKMRSQIRRADREQLTVEWGHKELIPEFYKVFASAMHELGTPVYPRRFFDIVCDALQEKVRVIVVRMRGRVHAAGVLLRHGTRMEVPWAVSTAASKKYSVNMRLYWEMLRYSIEVGATAFDFGRSSVDSGTYRFKAQWGAEPVQLHWHCWMANGKALPQINHSNPKFALAIAMWRRMPLWMANAIGPQIAGKLP